ncbi:cytochrome P450 4F3 [Gadus macrocephalus]|uniref:cytochrome P450 4F3 n=1 Tax=Gadus macrocephalus TaxID=80720 RepID=UPI0028CB2238|nr:cytochrome P450 4F3 [Gadus macrocephalus]
MSVLGVLWGVSALFFSNLLRGGPWQVLVIAATALVGVATAWVGRLLLRHAWFRHRLSCFSTPPAQSWLMGHLGQMRDSEEGLLDVDRLVRTHGHSCSWFLGPFYHLVRVFHPDFTNPLLKAAASITVKDELFYGLLRPWLGQSLLLSNGEEWSRRRRLLTPAFHVDVLKGYVAVFNNATHTMHSKWMRLSREGQGDLEMFQHVGLMTLDSLLRCAFSHSSDCQETSNEFTTAILELGDLIMDRRRRIHHHWDWIYWRSPQGKRFRRATEVVHSFTRRVVEHRRALIRKQSHRESLEGTARGGTAGDTAQRQKRKDFIDIILLAQDEEGGGLTDKEVEAETNTFMFAGHDTTASAICWTLFNLAGHAHYQDRCRDEVKELMRDRAEQDIKWADLSSMPFTTMCIKESLRLHSPVLAVTRQYTRDVDLPGNRTVPKDTICLVSIYGTHHNPAVWSDPNEFNPLRFDPANTRERSSNAFIPFSSGPRNCIGQRFAMAELQVVVALTLLRFRLSLGSNPDTAGTSTGQGIRRLPQLVLRAEGGMWLRLELMDPPCTEGLHAQ